VPVRWSGRVLPDGWTGHLELELGGGVILLGRRGGEFAGTESLTQVFVPDAAAARATGLGGSVLSEPVDLPWGVRQAVVADPEGQRWALSQHLRDVDPAQWYGQLSPPTFG
jgi:uncharacterized glyoxalase superfamily protein PhnB